MKDNIKPLPADTDLSTDSYLEETHYPEHRKQAIHDAVERHDPAVIDLAYREAKCFIKDETYEKYKAPRWIMSRCEAFKGEYGPYVHRAEREVYQNAWFVKGLTPEERLLRLQEMDLVGAKFFSTDHTAFEAAITPETMAICEFTLMDHLFKNHEGYRRLRRLENSVIGRPNHLKCSRVIIDGVMARMSGDNCTSLGNGFTNLMAILFCQEELGGGQTRGLVEGDDAIFVTSGKAPTTEDYKKLGFEVKMVTGMSACELGFCGLEADSVVLDAITDPMKVLLNFGWANRQYLFASDWKMRALARCKALSFAHMYPACPILAPFVKRVLELTRDITHYQLVKTVTGMKIGQYGRDKLLDAVHKIPQFHEIHPMTRILMQVKYGFSVEEQKALESRFSQLEFEPIHLPGWVEAYTTRECADYWDRFVVDTPHAYGFPPVVDWRDSQVVKKLIAVDCNIRVHS